jgi:hypothetical protein
MEMLMLYPEGQVQYGNMEIALLVDPLIKTSDIRGTLLMQYKQGMVLQKGMY